MARHPVVNRADAPAVKLNTRQKKEAEEMSRFIDAHGGRLGAFRGYGAGARVSPKEDAGLHARDADVNRIDARGNF